MLLNLSPVWAAALVILTVAVIGTLIGLLVSAFVPAPLATMKRFLSILAGILTAVILGLLVWVLVVSGVTFSPVRVAPVVVSNPNSLGAPSYVAPAQPVPAQSQSLPAGSTCTRRSMTVQEATNLVDATASDEFADSLTVLFGQQADTQCLQNFTSSVGNWSTNGPSMILVDPGHLAITGGARVVKTWEYRTDWIFGVYFCPSGSTCVVPTPGRAVSLDGDLPANYLH